MASTCKIIQRGIATSSVFHGKRNFRKFLLYNKRGPKEFKERQAKNPDPDIPIDKRGVKDTGRTIDGKFVMIPEMIPELIVPDLTGFKLKPYVSYRSTSVIQGPFTAKDLFNVVYAKKITQDFNDNKLDANGEPLEPSEHESMTPEKAKELTEECVGENIPDRPRAIIRAAYLPTYDFVEWDQVSHCLVGLKMGEPFCVEFYL